MPKLPHLPQRPPPPSEAERLSRWFREWDVEQQLRKENPEYAEPMRPPPVAERPQTRKLADLRLVTSFDSDVRVGQIRILHGGMFAEMRRPMHIAILSEWPPSDGDSDNEETQNVKRTTENPRNIVPIATRRVGSIEATPTTIEGKSYLVAPFGAYQEPATTTEWLTGRDVGPLQVLCLWNTRDYPARWLGLGWVVGEMTPQELADAWDVFRHALTGIPLSDRLRAQVGAPIIHPRDPRLAYQAEETRFFTIVPEYAEYRWKIEETKKSDSQPETADTNVSQQSTGSRNIRPLGFPLWPLSQPTLQEEMAKGEMALAAGTASAGLRKWTYLIAELQVLLVLRLESDKQTVSINVYDTSGKPSKTLNQAELINADGQAFAQISSASGRVKAIKESGFALRLADGRVFVPKPVN
jgi:hypothetical protein